MADLHVYECHFTLDDSVIGYCRDDNICHHCVNEKSKQKINNRHKKLTLSRKKQSLRQTFTWNEYSRFRKNIVILSKCNNFIGSWCGWSVRHLHTIYLIIQETTTQTTIQYIVLCIMASQLISMNLNYHSQNRYHRFFINSTYLKLFLWT